MSLTADLHPSELFRHMHVRGPRKATAGFVQKYFVSNVYESLSTNELSAIQRETATLYPDLVPYADKVDKFQRYRAAATHYQQTSAYCADHAAYASAFPQVLALKEWLEVAAPGVGFHDVMRFVDATSDDRESSLASPGNLRLAQCVIWDNLLANLVTGASQDLVALACKFLGSLHVVDVAAEVSLHEPGSESEVQRVFAARALVPKWLFEPEPDSGEMQEDTLTPNEPPANVSGPDPAERLGDLKTAIDEVRWLVDGKVAVSRLAARRPAASMPGEGSSSAGSAPQREVESPRFSVPAVQAPNPHEVTAADVSTLSSATRALVEGLVPAEGAVEADHVLAALVAEAGVTGAEAGARPTRQSVRVGNAIVSTSDHCCEMDEADPCAKLPRKKFKSSGSFVNSMLIGDLLVTRQQLIKYDAGEIAHVEALMLGLSKERTHRRLDRTETTTSFERESSNETERETQTTERFSMEKETSRAIQQDFKISTGVTASGKYGTTEIESRLDASFGYSQEQSSKDATSFSRNVTERALSRVKELVRESQTVSVVHEIEETSVHSLSNVEGATDHVNGVYRWLDKFYLNKVVNYGERLMFEFEVPEPANFYIFRALNKPPAGAAVENPIPPGEMTVPWFKPGVQYSLTDASVIADWNYTFWAALYGASNVTAPPQEYIYLASAYKSSSSPTTKDEVDAFAATIEVPSGYEAVMANTYVENYHDSKDLVHGTIDCMYFPEYATWNILLNGIRRSIGVSLLTKGLRNWSLNVTLKCKRSAEAYDAWKVDTYNKIVEAYEKKKRAYEEWLNAQYADAGFGFSGAGNNPGINREIEREELKMRCLEMFTGQRFESFDAATNGIDNVSGYPEIVFKEALAEGNLVRFFEQAFEWENLTYIFYPTFWGRKQNWPAIKNMEDAADPLFTKFLQAGYARVVVPARPGFEPYLTVFHSLANFAAGWGAAFEFSPDLFTTATAGGWVLNDPTYLSVAEELMNAAGAGDPNGIVVGHYVQKVPTNLVYVVPATAPSGGTLPGLPDYSDEPDIHPYLFRLHIAGVGAQIAGDDQQLTISALDAQGGIDTTYTGDKTLIFSGVTGTGGVMPTVTDKAGTPVDFGQPTTITFTNGVSTAGGLMTLHEIGTSVVGVDDGTIAATGADRLTVVLT